MTSVLRACFLSRGRQLFLQTSLSKSREFVCLVSRYQSQEGKETSSRARLFTSEKNNLSRNKRERLYEGTLHRKIRCVKIFSLATSSGSLLCQPYLISKAAETGSNLGAGAIILVFGFFAFVTPLMLHLITKRYVAYVDYDPIKDTYIATTYSLFVQKKEVEFEPADVKLPEMSEMLTSCVVKGIPMFMDVQFFTNIDHYKRIMGFDKPMDFSLHAEDTSSKKN